MKGAREGQRRARDGQGRTVAHTCALPNRANVSPSPGRVPIGRLALACAVLTVATAATATPTASATTRVWAVGDAAVPGLEDEALASRIASKGIDRLLYLGDVYENGTAMEYATNYASSWDRFKQITSPAPGNHEWPNRAAGYDPYWGALAPRNGGGHYYSLNIDGWHIVSLNSHEDSGPNSKQAAWLSRDLSRYRGTCTIAFHHRPRFASGGHGDAPDLEPLYSRLAGRAVALLSGHNHNYERLQAQRGLVQFVAGSGGRELDSVAGSDPRLAAYDDKSHGALELILHRGRAEYRFVRSDGTQGDSGALHCRPHSAPRVRILRPGDRRAYTQIRTLHGRTAGGKAPVRLTVVRRSGAGCQAFDGRRLRPASCRTRRSVRARGLRRWRYRLRAPLPRGRYRVRARVVGSLGATVSTTVRFRVR